MPGYSCPQKKKEKVEAEEVEPKTWAEKASDSLGDLLQDAAKARTLSIKLGPVQYASELALQMKNHANHLEKLYHNIRVALDKKSDDKTYKKLLNQVAEGATFTTKSQAGSDGFKVDTVDMCVLFCGLRVSSQSFTRNP